MPVVPLDPSSPRVFEAVSVPLSSVEVRDEAVEAVWSRYTEGRRALLGRWADSVPVTAADLFFMESALLKQHPQFPACPLTLRFAAAGGDGPAACHPGYAGDPLALDPAAPPAGLIPGPLSAEVLVADRDAPALNWMPVCGGPAAQFGAALTDPFCAGRSGRAFAADGRLFAFGADPYAAEQNPFAAAVLAVVEAASCLTASGADLSAAVGTLFGCFGGLAGREGWGDLLAACLGAFGAGLGLGLPLCAGSVTGRTEETAAPPALAAAVSAPAPDRAPAGGFVSERSVVSVFAVPTDGNGLPLCSAAAESFRRAAAAAAEGKLLSAFSLGRGGLYEAIPKMCLENGVGFAVSENADPWEFGRAGAGGILAESAEPLPGAAVVGRTCPEPVIDLGRLGRVPLAGLKRT